MTCAICGSSACRPITCSCSSVLGCLREPEGISWSETEWESRLSGFRCASCPAPPLTLEQQLEAQGTTLHEASLLLVQSKGDEAPQWAKDYVAEYLSRVEGLAP